MTQVTIHDPNGTASFVREGRLFVKAISQTALQDVSAEKGQAFSYTSTYAATAGQEILTIQNLLNQHMHIDQVWLSSLAAAVFSIGPVSSGSPSGTPITGVALNQDLSKVADTTAFGNASVTGSVVVTDAAWLGTGVGASQRFDLEGAWVFGKDDVFGIRCDTTTTVYATVIVHFDAID